MDIYYLREIIKESIERESYFKDSDMIKEINSSLVNLNDEYKETNEDFKDYKFSKNTIKNENGIIYYAYRDEDNFILFDDKKETFKLKYITDNLETLFILDQFVILYDEIYFRASKFNYKLKASLLNKVKKEIWKAYYECICNTEDTRLETLYFLAETQLKVIKIITDEEDIL